MMQARDMMIFFPALGALVVVSGTAYVALDNINDIKVEQERQKNSVAAQFSAERSVRMAQVQDLEESMDDTEDEVEELEKLLLQNNGDIKLTIQKIETQQGQLSEQMKTMIELMKAQMRDQ